MKKDIGSYIPFIHENFEFKKGVIELARKQPQTFEGIHVATLIYVNAIDYIAQHLLEHLMYMTYLLTNKEFNCVIFYSQVKPDNVSLGNTMRELNKYEFPDKKDFMEGLNEFVSIRNRLLHNLLSLSSEEIAKLSDDFTKIKELGDGLLTRYDSVTEGIKGAWYAYLSRLNTAGKIPISTTEEVKENIEDQDTDKKADKSKK